MGKFHYVKRVVSWLPALLVAFLLALSWPVVARAQTIVDARRVEFTPSVDNDVLVNSTPIVTNYSLTVFVAGDITPAETVNLGKPAPDVDGMIRVDFVALLVSPLTPGIVYETALSAVGPGGASSPSTRSNTFGFSQPCAASISPLSQSTGSAGGSGRGSDDRRGLRVDGHQQCPLDRDHRGRRRHGPGQRHLQRAGILRNDESRRHADDRGIDVHRHPDRDHVFVLDLADESGFRCRGRLRLGDVDHRAGLRLVGVERFALGRDLERRLGNGIHYDRVLGRGKYRSRALRDPHRCRPGIYSESGSA